MTLNHVALQHHIVHYTWVRVHVVVMIYGKDVDRPGTYRIYIICTHAHMQCVPCLQPYCVQL
jgi:hypothetical protein